MPSHAGSGRESLRWSTLTIARIRHTHASSSQKSGKVCAPLVPLLKGQSTFTSERLVNSLLASPIDFGLSYYTLLLLLYLFYIYCLLIVYIY